MSHIKGHDSNDEEVVGIMKNLLFNIIHGVPINYHDFFMRTLANVPLSLFELKPHAPWIMRFIRSRSSINYKVDILNHGSYFPPPPLKSSNRLFPQLMRRERPLSLMKELVHWMASLAKLHPTPSMMTLPLMTLAQMLRSQILK